MSLRYKDPSFELFMLVLFCLIAAFMFISSGCITTDHLVDVHEMVIPTATPTPVPTATPIPTPTPSGNFVCDFAAQHSVSCITIDGKTAIILSDDPNIAGAVMRAWWNETSEARMPLYHAGTGYYEAQRP